MDQFQNIHAMCIAEEGILFSTSKGRNKVMDNISKIESSISGNLDMCKKAIPLIKDYLAKCDKTWDDEERPEAEKIAKIFYDKAIALDYDRGSDQEMKAQSMAFLKYRFNKTFNRADMKHKDVQPAVLALYEKCAKGGTYGEAYREMSSQYVDLTNTFSKLCDKYENVPLTMAMLRVARDEMLFFMRQVQMTGGDFKVAQIKNKPIISLDD